MLLDSDKGGLGIGSLQDKNLGLLRKWKWRFLTEKKALWRLVIRDFYGEDGGFYSSSNSSMVSGVWFYIIKASASIDSIDPDFKNSFYIKVSNGSNVSFWKDVWCRDGVHFMDAFPQLYALDSIQEALGELEALIAKVGNLSLSRDGCDKWQWKYDASGKFKVSTLSRVIQNLILAD
ncbi:hypothetical protein Tco_1049577, partial [Tanacetum coccineum]